MLLLFAALLLSPIIATIISILLEASNNYTSIKWDNATMKKIAYSSKPSITMGEVKFKKYLEEESKLTIENQKIFYKEYVATLKLYSKLNTFNISNLSKQNKDELENYIFDIKSLLEILVDGAIDDSSNWRYCTKEWISKNNSKRYNIYKKLSIWRTALSSPPSSLYSTPSPIAKTLVSIKAITDKLTEHQSEIDARLFAKAQSLSSNVTELMSLYNMTDDKDLQGEVLNQLVIINDALADDLDAAKLPGTDSYVMEKLKINKIYLDSAKNS